MFPEKIQSFSRNEKKNKSSNLKAKSFFLNLFFPKNLQNTFVDESLISARNLKEKFSEF